MAKITKSLLIFGFSAFVFFAHGAASQGGKNSLVLERELRDAFMNSPPFSTPAQEPVAPVPPPPHTQAALPPAQVQSAYIPAPPAPPSAIPEMRVRGYSIDPSGAINVIGMDGVLITVDGSRPVKLIFPPEYGLAPQIVGGTRPAVQPYPANQPQVVIGVQPAPPASGGGDLAAGIIQEGIGAILNQMKKR